ncbi:hypothetical protein OCS_00408 [Ophiocordyceps sinensis CO18]|uniref:Uncharacterized protein n=1 Tax=Ophiocordyceps sinensis (strain Co18 / CGMCC 3.14243) TaxID=911162 RepID=T5AMN6_OPHSC|nr:hypothetical protein OCS_00408 [Ophiocordyceps sinensis CO18]
MPLLIPRRVEDQINSADVSVSGGSDTEASRTDWTRQRDGDKSHGRTGSSAKKPATFKAVSVNKTFLASKASPGSTVSKASDKPNTGAGTPPPGSATLSISRPRLVAKTGSGARDSTPRLSLTVNGGKPATAPDPNVVWNKNRPPEPKKFTDEELKKYGIHMASRLNEDDAQGQGKWADIDDDDDDWAPEAITWGDGTKTTLPHPDEQVAALSENGDDGSVTSKGKSQDKPKSPAPPALAGSPLPKPGSLASGKGLILKIASQDRPALVAKPPVPPTPAKSPWATLPPVDRASPVLAEAGNSTRAPPKEPHRNAVLQPKEIAADDFSRSSWRDGPSHGSRELYNSHSGRYELVLDRRGSIRSDAQAKHPALLHRPQPSDQPAEPSSAFQTSRISQEGPFGRRRGSSNVSGGSGSYMQRLGKGNDGLVQPLAEPLGARRTSLAGSAENPLSPVNLPVSGPAPSRPQPPPSWAPRASPGEAFAIPHNNTLPREAKACPPPPVDATVDDVEFQKKLMRERIELAKKRRQEEIARDEAAKKERIKKKLEALGPPPEKTSEKKDAASKDEAPKPTQIKQRKSPESAQGSGEAVSQERQIGPDANDQGRGNAHGAPAQTMSAKDGPPPGSSGRRLSHGQEGKRSDLWSGPGPRPERFTSWAAGVPPSSRNVWGSPDHDRGLGNGTFNPDLGRIPGSTTATVPSQTHKGPPPIAPPNRTRAPSHGQAHPPNPIGPQSSRYGAAGSNLASKWVAAVAEGDKEISAARATERAGRERQLAEQGLLAEDAQPTIKDTWRPVQLPGDGTRRAAGNVEVQSHVTAPWKTAQEKLAKGAAPAEDPVPSANPGVIGSGSGSIIPSVGSGPPSQLRASRFFPARDSRHEHCSAAAEPWRPASPSLPPPTMEGHPAYEGDVVHPHVSLPKPQPVVKLPPAMMASQLSQPRGATAWAGRLSFKEALRAVPNRGPIHTREGEPSRGTWQDKIDTLLSGSKPLSQRHIGVDPASRNVLEPLVPEDLATVSLPSVSAEHSTGILKSVVSKPMAEDCFEEQEMGSLPQIRFPHRAPEAAWQPAMTPTKALPKKLLVQATAMEPYYFAADVFGGGNLVKVLLPGMTEVKMLTLPFSATRAGRGGHGRPPPRQRGLGHGSRGGRREVSNTFGGKDSGSGNSSRNGRGSYRRRGSDSWNRQQSQALAQPRTPST